MTGHLLELTSKQFLPPQILLEVVMRQCDTLWASDTQSSSPPHPPRQTAISQSLKITHVITTSVLPNIGPKSDQYLFLSNHLRHSSASAQMSGYYLPTPRWHPYQRSKGTHRQVHASSWTTRHRRQEVSDLKQKRNKSGINIKKEKLTRQNWKLATKRPILDLCEALYETRGGWPLHKGKQVR